MKPAKLSFVIYQGATWEPDPIIFRNPDPPDGDGTPIDLTGKKARFEMRAKASSSVVLLAFSTDTGWITPLGVDGALKPKVPSTTTTALPTGRRKRKWVGKFEIYDDSVTPTLVDRVIEAKITVVP